MLFRSEAAIREPDKVAGLAAKRNDYTAAIIQIRPVSLKVSVTVRLVPTDPSLLPAFEPRFRHLIKSHLGSAKKR